MTGRPRIVCLVGPTAVGKSALAVELAERLGAEIVSADSRQVYRGLDIGTAKPTPAEQARVPHHGLDLVDPGTPFDAARFRDLADVAIADVCRRGRHALVVGGTGLYVRALLHGLCPAPPRVPVLRAALGHVLAARGRPALHRGLAALDPVAAARIAPRDAVRTIRALEVALATGVRLSEWQQRHRFADTRYDALVLGLGRPPDELAARIAARARAMVAAGWLDEVRSLRRRGLEPGMPGLGAIGYAEMLACAEGRTDITTALTATVEATRRFAKRQRTWFRRDADIVWRHPDEDTVAIMVVAEAFLASGTRPAPAAA